MEDTTTQQERRDLTEMVNEKVAELAAIASRIDGPGATIISSRIRTLLNHIERLPKAGPDEGKYVTFKVATHVIEQHLRETGHAIRVPALIEEILAEKYLGGREEGRDSLRKCLGSFATGRGRITGTIKIDQQEFTRQGALKDGWVWLGEWEDPRIPLQ